MKKSEQFKLLIKNSFRILNKSKLLMSQLSFLVVMGLSIILTIFLSNTLLNKSKENIINNGNLANFTITIPNEIRQASINDSNESVFIPTDSPVDLELKEKLDDLGLYYAITNNITLSDAQSNSSFIAYEINNETNVNKLITVNGNNFPLNKYDFNYLLDIKNSIILVKNLSSSLSFIESNYQNFQQFFIYDNYINIYQPWKLMKIIKNGIWNLEISKVIPILKVVEKLCLIPNNETEYNEYYNLFNANGKLNENSYWYKWRNLMSFANIVYNGYGYEISCKQVVPLLGDSSAIPFTIQLYDLSSYFTIISNNYFNSNNKSAIPLKTLMDVLQLPLINYNTSESSLNPSTSVNVFNPDTGESEPQTSFVTWMNNLDDKYKVYVNAIPYVIIDQGITPDMMYPCLNSNNLLVDSKTSGVSYFNSAGYYRVLAGNSSNTSIYYSVRYPPDMQFKKQNNIFDELKDYSLKTYGYNTVYQIDDPNQPNNLIYLRANFLDNLENIILIIGCLVGVIIGFLSLFFIGTLIRSIVKQNKTTFGIGIANGITKSQLALSFFPFALVPAIICGILSYIFSVLLTNPINDVIAQYWTLSIPKSQFEWWPFIIVIIGTFLLLYILVIFVILWTLRKKIQEILTSQSEFRMNWLIVHTKKITKIFGAFGSFRITYLMGNISRFLLLTFIVTLFSTLISFSAGTLNQFSIAQSYTNRNKSYTYAFDLYSPTLNAGYYSPMPYSELGVSQEGIYNYYSANGGNINGIEVNGWYVGNYDTPLTAPNGSFYSGNEYANALQYPYGTNKYLTSLYLPYTDLATQIEHNINFFNNKVFVKAVLDVYIDIGGALINPWEIAKSIMPATILNLANNLFETQIETNFHFYYWLQQQNEIAINGGASPYLVGVDSQFNGKPIYFSTYLPNVTTQPFTLDGSDLTSNYLNAPNQDQWIFVKVQNYDTNEYEWKINQDNAMYAAPTYTIKPKALQNIVQILTNSQNPLFQYWYKFFYQNNPELGNPNQDVPEFSYKVGYGAVPVESTDETYTYIDSTIEYNSNTISGKIVGIKENSKYINLYDNKNQIISNLLTNYNVCNNTYPLIINEVVNKAYNINIGDIITVKANNIYDRFNRKNIGIDSFREVNFEVVGITSSKSEFQFYTLQTYANKILGYGDYINSESIEWNGPNNPGIGYVPFNGVFTNQTSPKMFYNYGGIYSPSSLTTSKGIWDTNINEFSDGGGLSWVIRANWNILPTLMRINYLVDYENNNEIIDVSSEFSNIPMYTNHQLNYEPNLDEVKTWIEQLVNTFETNQPLVNQITTLDTTMINTGSIFDNTFQQLEFIIVLCFIPTLLIIIILMTIMIVTESTRLVSLMKVLGISDFKNAFSFMFVYWVVLFLGIIISIPITIGAFSLLSYIVFGAFKIIINPIAPVWIFFVIFGIIAIAFALINIYGYNKIRKINVPQVISVR